jgi:hypothetical protein
MSAEWNNFPHPDGDLNDTEARFDSPTLSEYNFRTPMKVSTGVTFISKFGFISGDVEFVNYGNSKYSSDIDGISYSNDNRSIKSLYTSVVNYRMGAEYRFKIYRLRAGYNVMADPYRTSSGVDRKIESISGGAGLRFDKFYTDIAVISSKTDNVRIPYTAIGLSEPTALQSVKNTNFLLTLGFTF